MWNKTTHTYIRVEKKTNYNCVDLDVLHSLHIIVRSRSVSICRFSRTTFPTETFSHSSAAASSWTLWFAICYFIHQQILADTRNGNITLLWIMHNSRHVFVVPFRLLRSPNNSNLIAVVTANGCGLLYAGWLFFAFRNACLGSAGLFWAPLCISGSAYISNLLPYL